MNYGWSIYFYRFLARAYPAEFRSRFGASVDQAFRDMMRDAFEKHGYPGLVLLWFQVLPDFLFSLAELLMKKAGDFLKWRLRLHWVVACSLGLGLARLIALMVGRDFYIELEALGTWGIVLGRMLQVAIVMTSIGVMQSWALAGRCFRKRAWVLYSLAGSVLAAAVVQFLLLTAAPSPVALVGWAQATFHGLMQVFAVRLVTNAPIWMIAGALTGLLQAAAIRSDAVSRYQWMRACATGYFLSAIVGGFVIPYFPGSLQPLDSALSLILTMVVSGAVLGLATSGPLERVLFNVQADSAD